MIARTPYYRKPFARRRLSSETRDPEQLVRGMFTVTQAFTLPDGEHEFQVAFDAGTRGKFVELSSKLEPLGFTPELGGSKEECVLVLRKSDSRAPKVTRVPVIFALFTMAALVVFALLQQQVYGERVPSIPGYVVFFGFGVTIAIMMAGHEAAQRLSGRRRKGGHASSYLIPAVPLLYPFPSLGFISSPRQPALNKDGLFDTVLAGPLAILALSIVFYALGDLTSVRAAAIAPGSQLANSTVSINSNAIQAGIDWLLQPFLPAVQAGSVQVSPIADGATVGFILAFIGFLPLAFYDGGFLSNLSLGEGKARIAGYVGVVALMTLDTPIYWPLAIIALLLAGRRFEARTLDEVSELSRSRKWVFAATLVLALLCVPFPHNIGTLQLP